jgi:UDP-N-acetylglucosamine 2-epimerase
VDPIHVLYYCKTDMKKAITIVGARPQFIKLAALSPAIRKYFKETIIHTGQHYDYKMSQAIFEELDIPIPDYNLEVGSGSALKQIAKMLIELDDVLEKERPDVIIVFGDTNSTAAGAIAAAKHQVPLAHIEAGLREFNKAIPEESNKLITDILCDFYFCPTQTGVDILKSMGITKQVYNVGDVMIDLDYRFLEEIKNDKSFLEEQGLKPKEYYFATCHRASNTNNPDNLKRILEAFVKLGKAVVFPVHPRTRKVIEEHDLQTYLSNTNIKAIEPIPYLATQKLIYHAAAVLTDSGGVTKEAYFFKVPGIILDSQTEWVETVNEGWNHIIGPDTKKIVETVKNISIPSTHTNCLGDGYASEKIASILNEYL